MSTIYFLTLSAMTMLSNAPAATTPWPEHPRPDFERSPWVNLNGTWQFAFDPKDVGEKEGWFKPGHAFERTIVVPYPWESKLSTVADTEYQGAAWYSREITLPAGEGWKDRDIYLVVGACDWSAKVWVNGQLAGENVGGYLPFDINLSKFAEPGGKITVAIRAFDITGGEQPTGKQIGWYTRTSGIWQTVYLEPRGKQLHIKSAAGVPKIADGTITWTIKLSDRKENYTVKVSSPDQSFDSVAAKWSPKSPTAEARIKIAKPQLWSPDTPKLYPVRFEITEGDALVDRVDSYIGLREISDDYAPGGRLYRYIQLNGKPVYLLGALHQSFHPDGIHQYPDDAAVRQDYEIAKQAGLNMLRIHIKVPTPRELYWADKLGVLIMQDIPCFWKYTEQAQKWWKQTLIGTVERDFNHPAIFAWVNFNETWGIGDGGYTPDRQEWVAEMHFFTRDLDPTRLCEDNSPCNYDHVVSDINSWHFYINDYAHAKEHIANVVKNTYQGSPFNYTTDLRQGSMPLMNSEYGGIGAGNGDQDVSWCFKYLTNELRLHDKICGYVYTELSDIEWEHNGFVDYDRSPKQFGYEFWFPGFALKDINNLDFVVIDAPPCVELKPGEPRQVPIRISHWSDRAGNMLQLRWRSRWLNGLGQWREGEWKSQPVQWEQYRVIDASPLEVQVDAKSDAELGALLVELTDGEQVVARNYVNLRANRGKSSRVQAVDDKSLAVRFSPSEFSAWSFAGDAPVSEGVAGSKVSSEGTGAVEYQIELPDDLPLAKLQKVTLLAELAAKGGIEQVDWPSRHKPADYPQTDARKCPSNVVLSINGVEIGRELLPDDPADATGVLSHVHRHHPGSYGYLVQKAVDGESLKKIMAAAGEQQVLRIRLEVPADAEHKGGLSVFGEQLGAYPLDPTCVLSFEQPHGVPADFRTDKGLAINRLVGEMQTVLPAADGGGHEWRYTTEQPADGWTMPTFNDTAWKKGKGGFGTSQTPNAIVGTLWETAEIWLRTEVNIDDPAAIIMGRWRIYHDEGAEVFVNGQQVLKVGGHVTHHTALPLTKDARAALQPGRNVIAVHCHQTAGGQNIDLGLSIARPAR